MTDKRGRVVLLDMDGTLIDPLAGIGASYRRAAERIGYGELSDDEIRALIGPPIQDVFCDRWGCSAADQRVAVEAFREYYQAVGIFDFEVYPGVERLLTSLDANGVRLGIATSKPLVFARDIVRRAGWDSLFSCVGGAELSGEKRAKHDVIESVLGVLGCRSDACVMVGDRSEDMRGAAVTSVYSVGVTWGYGTAGELRSAGASVVVHAPAECEMVIRSLDEAT